MLTLRHALAVGAAMLVAGPSANAQLRRTTVTIPDAQTMPAGMCRIWIDGVPASRQPAPTDCTTARRNQPRNSRLIVGTRRPGNVYGNRDPRSIPGTPQYDPRYDPRSSRYDPRLDPHDNGRYERDRLARERAIREARERQDRERAIREARERERARIEYQRRQEREQLEYRRKQEREREKYEKKQEKEREKDARKANHGNGNGHAYGRDGDHDRRDGRDDRDDRNRGDVRVTQTVPRTLPQGVPQTVPQGTTRGVCVDANRDGKCDDGGPLIRNRP